MAETKEKDKYKNVDFVRGGTAVQIPEGMQLTELAKWVERKQKEELQKIKPVEIFDCFPLDGAVQLAKALKDLFGWTSLIPQQSWFGEIPPTIIAVQTGPETKDVVRVPWGNMGIPAMTGGYIMTSAHQKDGRWHFLLTGEITQKDKPIWDKIVEKTHEFIKNESIYKGKALRIDSFVAGRFDFTTGVPKFMNLSTFTKKDLILPFDVYTDVNAAVFTMIERADEALLLGIPQKRTVLLAGEPGVGKTLTATVAAPLCVANGRTMWYVTDPHILPSVIRAAQPYGKSMIFVEDIDRVAGGEDRTDEINELLNTIDGVDTKQSDILFVLTTNHPERLNQAFKRHGRSDWVITIPAPDARAAADLVLRYGKGVVDITDEEAVAVGSALAEVKMIPASIAEVVQRAKLYALANAMEHEIITISKDDLLHASEGVRDHVRMMKEKPPAIKHLKPMGTLYLHQNISPFEMGLVDREGEEVPSESVLDLTQEEQRTA